MTKLEILNNKLIKARGKYLDVMNAISIEVSDLVDVKEIFYNDFPGDGLGIGIEDDTYVGVEDLILRLKQNGILTINDFNEAAL